MTGSGTRIGIIPLEKRVMLDASLPAIAGQVLWLDAADATTILDADGDNAATGTGGANDGFSGSVKTWADKSISNYDVSAPTAAEMPTYTINGLNAKNVITLDGVNDRLINTLASIPGDDFTVFIVFNRTTATARDAVLEMGGGGSRNGWFINDGNNGKINYYLNGTFYNYTSNYSTGNYELISTVQNTNAIGLYRSAISELSTTGGTRAATTGIYVGDDSTSGDQLQGNIAEIIIYDHDLTADERHDVENYLASKWGLGVSNFAPTIGANTGKTLIEGATAIINNTNLSATDADNSEAILLYTISNDVDYGTLTNTNTALTLGLGDTFTQGDLDNGYITYTHDGSENFADSFSFTVTDSYATTAGNTFGFSINPVNDAPAFDNATIVSSENFEGGAVGWSDNTTETGGAIYTTFLGRHSLDGGTQNVFKTYALSGTQSYITISFDMYEIDSWDGENFGIYVDDVLVYNSALHQSAFNAPADGSSGAVSWTVQETTPFNANFAYGSWTDQRYHFNLTVATASATVKLGFTSTLNQAATDEAWGVDNIIVTEVGGGGTPGPFIVSEKSSNGDAFGQVSATDPDVGDTLTYTITGGTGMGIFALNPSTGILTVANAAALDYETITSYTLDILVTDTGGLTDTATITINVLDVPENTAPVINPLGPLSVAENAVVNTVLGTVTSTDAESNTVTYAITAGNTDNLFAINSTTGAIRLSSTTLLNYEWHNTYTLTIRATDNGFGVLSSTRNVTINIIDVNEAPDFDAIQSVLATDPNIKYSATTGNFYKLVTAGTNQATAITNAAALTLNGVAGYLATSTSAAENALLTSMITTSTWLGGRDTVVEGEWLWATGPETGQMFWLGAAAGSAQNGFYTNWTGGEPNDSGGNEDGVQLRTNGTWNDIAVTTNMPYLVEWDGAAVLAAVQNGPYTLAENSPNATSVGFAHAYDPDAGDVLTYSITGGTGTGIFALNSSTGEITLTNAAAIDYETTTSYTLDLLVQDLAGLTDTVTVTINIADVNETPVLDVNTGTTLNEGASKTITSAMLSSSDVDAPPDSALLYTLTSAVAHGTLINTNTALALGLGDTFTQGDIDNGYITYTHDDTENFTDAFSFTVSDGGITLPAATFNFIINPVNEVPVFTATGPYSLVENSANGTSVGLALASDVDTGDVLAYSITGGTGMGRFAINSTTGEITLTDVAAANYELATSYTLDLKVQDTGGLFDTATVTINITDANDTPTAIDLSGKYVKENSAVGKVVGLLSTTDEDPADTHTYTILGNPGNKFTIVGNELRVNGKIDYEATQTIKLLIRTDDGNGGTYDSNFIINIGDEQDTYTAPPVSGANSGGHQTSSANYDLSEKENPLLRETLRNGEMGQQSAFYGLNKFLQIIREKTTSQIRELTGKTFESGYNGDMPQEQPAQDGRVVEEQAIRAHYTNIRTVLENLEKFAEEDPAHQQNPDHQDQDHTPDDVFNPLDSRFVDVMTYHEQKQEKLRQVLMG